MLLLVESSRAKSPPYAIHETTHAIHVNTVVFALIDRQQEDTRSGVVLGGVGRSFRCRVESTTANAMSSTASFQP